MESRWWTEYTWIDSARQRLADVTSGVEYSRKFAIRDVLMMFTFRIFKERVKVSFVESEIHNPEQSAVGVSPRITT